MYRGERKSEKQMKKEKGASPDYSTVKKRMRCTKMDRIRLTPGNGPVGGASSQNSGADSTSCKIIREYPQRCTTGTDDSVIKETKLYIGRFFYENGLDFCAVNSPSFQKMIALFCGTGVKDQIPTIEELKGWIYKEVMKEMHEHVDEIRQSWAETGCSILLDGWTDANGRSLVNVIVDCPRGTMYLCSSDITACVGNMDAMQSFFVKVLADVGIKNVVQIIANSHSTFMKEAGRLLMEKYRPIFWTVSASYCIEVMLEKLRTINVINETLEKAKIITRFFRSHPIARKYLQDQNNGGDLVDSSKIRSIRPFITLENIVMAKEILQTMFSSSHPQTSILTSNTEGRRVAELVGDRSFWNEALSIVIGAIPLVRVMEWLDQSGKDHIGYIYETIDQAKETIKEGFEHKKSSYSPFWKVIDDVWNDFLYSPLHSAGYYLNPSLFYSSTVFIDPEVVTGLYCCIVRSAADHCTQDRITVQMEHYRLSKGAMAAGLPEDRRSNIPPAIWWLTYGGECPELQRLAVRILSQTCDGAAKFQLNRSLAETMLTKGRNRNDQKRVKDMVFLRYNMQLKNFVPGKTNYVMSNELDLDDDWIVEKLSNGVVPKDEPS